MIGAGKALLQLLLKEKEEKSACIVAWQHPDMLAVARCPMAAAAEKGYVDVIEFLLLNGADINNLGKRRQPTLRQQPP
eukprot:scaffold602_cov298-Pinguiococcus_pyrenoidosus.AAC.40